MIDELRAAAEALNRGDPEPFAALFAADAEWRGISRGHLWWKRTPAWHGPDEAREVLQFQIKKRGELRVEVHAEFRQVGDKIIGSTQWLQAGSNRVERYQVLTVRDGKIVDMQGCSSRRQAERFARTHWADRTLTKRTLAITRTSGVKDAPRDETVCSSSCGIAASMRDFHIGDRVTFSGRAYFVRGFSPMSVAPTIHLEDAETGELVEVPVDDLAGRVPPDAIRDARQLNSD